MTAAYHLPSSDLRLRPPRPAVHPGGPLTSDGALWQAIGCCDLPAVEETYRRHGASSFAFALATTHPLSSKDLWFAEVLGTTSAGGGGDTSGEGGTPGEPTIVPEAATNEIVSPSQTCSIARR